MSTLSCSSSLPIVPVGRICGALYARGDGTFHWALVVPVDLKTGVKMHATNVYGGGWIYEKKTETFLESMTPLCTLIAIGEFTCTVRLSESLFSHHNHTLGDIPPTITLEKMSTLLEAIPMSISSSDMAVESRFSCRVWFKQAVRSLMEHGIVKCRDVIALENEMKRLAADNEDNIIMGLGTFTVQALT